LANKFCTAEKSNEGITRVWQKWRFSTPQTQLWLIKVWFSASTFVVKIATFAKPENVMCQLKTNHMGDFREIIKEKSDAELTDIFIKNTGYQEAFMNQVEEELISRKIPIESLQKFRSEQDTIDVSKLEKGEQGSQVWIVLGFLASIAGGLWGIFAGYNYAYSKHRFKGEQYYIYNESTRKYGRIMLTWAILMFVFSAYRILFSNNN
jgi:hypothetical protein